MTTKSDITYQIYNDNGELEHVVIRTERGCVSCYNTRPSSFEDIGKILSVEDTVKE